MPAWRLDADDRQVSQYDVGAVDGEETHFIRHALLCDVDEPINVSSTSASVPSVHMVPPLQRSDKQINVVGTAELDAGEVNRGKRRQIKIFIDDRLLEHEAQKDRLASFNGKLSEYVIHPSARKPDANYPLWRFNCAGFVLSAYLEADIELVDESHVPEVGLDALKVAYPECKSLLDHLKFRKDMGIDIGDRWPVIMAGYVVNSLNRSANEIRQTPYRPLPGDEFFPSRC